MPTELVKRVNLDLLNPDFLERLLNLVAWCRDKRQTDYFVISGFRSYAEQAKLYFQGRTQPGRIVTMARPGQSHHNFGLAADLCRDKDKEKSGLQPDWDPAAYEYIGQGCEEVGLEWAGNWTMFREYPHVQLPKVDLKKVREAYEKNNDLKEAWWAI